MEKMNKSKHQPVKCQAANQPGCLNFTMKYLPLIFMDTSRFVSDIWDVISWATWQCQLPILGWHSAEIQSPRHVGIGVLRSLKYGSLNCFSPMFSHQNGRQMHIHPSNSDLSTDLIYDFICHPVILGGYGKSPQQLKSVFITGHFPELRWYIYIYYIYIYVITPSHKV